MHTLSRFVSFAVLSIVPLSALALSPSVYVMSATISGDFDTATINLSQSLPYATVRYDMYLDNEIVRNGGISADGQTVVTMSGLRYGFEDKGEGMYKLGFQVCQHGADRLNTDVDCSERTFIDVDFVKGFRDVSSNHPNKEAIDYVRAQGIVQGYSDGTYKPDSSINRAEFTKIVVKALLEPGDFDCGKGWGSAEGMGSPFSDVRGSDWFAWSTCRAHMEGLITGYPDHTFRPSANINFAEAAKILANGFEVPFNSTNVWYEGYVRGLERKNAIPSSIKRFDQNITRGEMAEMIYRLKTGTQEAVPGSYEDIERGSTTFDGCGKVLSYAKYPWFKDFAAQAEKNGFDMEYSEGFSEGCLALDESLFLAIYSGGYCEGSRFLLYKPYEKNLDTAGILWKEEHACGHQISEFGPRRGSHIELTGGWGDAGCSSTFYYDYDMVSNVITKTAMKSWCQDEAPSWTYYE